MQINLVSCVLYPRIIDEDECKESFYLGVLLQDIELGQQYVFVQWYDKIKPAGTYGLSPNCTNTSTESILRKVNEFVYHFPKYNWDYCLLTL